MSNKQQQKLSEFNQPRWELFHKQNQYPKLNNLICDSCEKELYDISPVESGYPSQIDVFCKGCGFKGKRFVR